MDFDQTENYAFSDVSIGIAHQHAQHISQVQQVLDKQRELLLADVRTSRSLLDEFLNISQLVLNHSKQCLQLRRLLLMQKRLNCIGQEFRVRRNHQPFKQVFSNLVRDTLMLWSYIRRVGF